MARDINDRTPLHWASSYGTPINIKALLDIGADVMARGKDGETPLHMAAREDDQAIILALLDAGADAKAKDEKARSPWDYAQENKSLKGTKGYWALNDAQYN
jgi:cytohesin